MINQMKTSWKDNLQYKLIALGVALVLWVVMLGRKDITLTRELPIQALVPPGHKVISEIPSKVKVEVAGPRIALKKFSMAQDVYTVDLEGLSPGFHRVRLTKKGLNLPLGTRLLSLEPQEILADIQPLENKNETEE